MRPLQLQPFSSIERALTMIGIGPALLVGCSVHDASRVALLLPAANAQSIGGQDSAPALPAVPPPQALVSQLMGVPDRSAASAVRNLAIGLSLPTDLKSVGIERDQFQAIAEHTMTDRGVRSNPRPINGPEDIVEILEIAAG